MQMLPVSLSTILLIFWHFNFWLVLLFLFVNLLNLSEHCRKNLTWRRFFFCDETKKTIFSKKSRSSHSLSRKCWRCFRRFFFFRFWFRFSKSCLMIMKDRSLFVCLDLMNAWSGRDNEASRRRFAREISRLVTKKNFLSQTFLSKL